MNPIKYYFAEKKRHRCNTLMAAFVADDGWLDFKLSSRFGIPGWAREQLLRLFEASGWITRRDFPGPVRQRYNRVTPRGLIHFRKTLQDDLLQARSPV